MGHKQYYPIGGAFNIYTDVELVLLSFTFWLMSIVVQSMFHWLKVHMEQLWTKLVVLGVWGSMVVVSVLCLYLLLERHDWNKWGVRIIANITLVLSIAIGNVGYRFRSLPDRQVYL